MQRSSGRLPGGFSDDTDEPARSPVVAMVQRRQPPSFLICDSAMRVVYAGPGLERIAGSPDRLEELRAPAREALRTGTPVVAAFDDETALRFVPLDAGLFGCVAIFVDVFSKRGSIFAAARTFQLTRRETQVLRLVVTGKSNPQIAGALFVAESTVADHVKSIMRKMSVGKRIEIMSKLVYLEQDFVHERT